MHHAGLFLNAAKTQTVADVPLLVDLSDQVLRLTINRPEKRNALSMDLLDELGSILSSNAANPDLKCAVITASGDRCFAAGGDLKELNAVRSREDAEAMSKRGRAALDAVRSFPLPVVAGLNGLALGGGAELAMACDLRVAAPNAEIGFLQGQLNVTTAWGGGIDLVATVGVQSALDLLITARRLSAQEALELGMINQLCEPDQSLTECLSDFLRPYLQRSNQVLRGYKSLATAQKRSAHERLSAIEQQHFITTWIHADHWTAVEQDVTNRKKNRK
jgi:enoyl-CoA hydratase